VPVPGGGKNTGIEKNHCDHSGQDKENEEAEAVRQRYDTGAVTEYLGADNPQGKKVGGTQENQIIKPIDQVKEIENIIKISKRIEEKRNDLAYSSPVEEDEILKEEINGYFRIKRIVEIETGDIHG